MPVDVLSVTLRAASFLTLFQAAGIALFLALREQQLPNTVPALRRVGTVAALIAASLLVAHYLLEAARMSGELAGMLDPTLQGLVLRSAASVTLSWRLLGLLLILAGLRAAGMSGRTVGVIGSVVLLASFTFIGHTSKDGLRWLLSPLLLTHLAVVAFWYGALLPLYLVSSREPPETAASVVQQFSARAVWLVPVLLFAKVAGFGALMVLATLNRWRFGPALQRGGPTAGYRFRYVVATEFTLLAAILCVTAVMTTFYSPDS